VTLGLPWTILKKLNRKIGESTKTAKALAAKSAKSAYTLHNHTCKGLFLSHYSIDKLTALFLLRSKVLRNFIKMIPGKNLPRPRHGTLWADSGTVQANSGRLVTQPITDVDQAWTGHCAIVPWHRRPPSTNTGAPWPLYW